MDSKEFKVQTHYTMKIFYTVKKRPNNYVKAKFDWALYITTDTMSNAWVFESWVSKPNEKKVKECIALIERSFEYFYKQINKPDITIEFNNLEE